MSLRVILTFLPDSERTDLPTVEFDMDDDLTVRGCVLTPDLAYILNDMAFRLRAFYVDRFDRKEASKC